MLVKTLLLLSFFIAFVVGKGLAGAYERIYFYLIYEAEGDLYAASKRNPLAKPSWAPTCVGTAPGDRCNFNEFIHFIENKPKPVTTYIKGGLQERTPEALQRAARTLDQKKLNGNLQKLSRISTGVNGYSGLLKNSGTAIQRLRTNAQNLNLEDIMSDVINDIKNGVNGVDQLRTRDHELKLSEHMEERFPNVKWTTVPKSFAGETWNSIDWKATLADPENTKDGTFTQAAVDAEIKNFESDNSPTITAKYPYANSGHLNIIRNVRTVLNC